VVRRARRRSRPRRSRPPCRRPCRLGSPEPQRIFVAQNGLRGYDGPATKTARLVQRRAVPGRRAAPYVTACRRPRPRRAPAAPSAEREIARRRPNGRDEPNGSNPNPDAFRGTRRRVRSDPASPHRPHLDGRTNLGRLGDAFRGTRSPRFGDRHRHRETPRHAGRPSSRFSASATRSAEREINANRRVSPWPGPGYTRVGSEAGGSGARLAA